MEFPQKNYLASQRMISSAILATAPHQLEQTAGLHGSVISPTSETSPSSSQKGFLTPKGILPPSVSPNMRGDPSSSPQVGFGPTGSFPYGISGVSMPSYGYQSELFKYVSNGTPRKSRMCCYCGKVFTRSTTRRYHERRCPLLRAAGSLAKDGEPPPPPPPDLKNEQHESPKNHKDCFSPPAHSTPNTFKLELPETNQQNTYGYTNVIVKSENRELPHTSHNVEPHEEDDYEVPTSINTPESHTSMNLQNSQALAQKSTENIPTSNLNLFDVNFSAEQFASQEIDRLFGTASDNVSIKDESYEPDSVDVYPENSGDNGDLPVSTDNVGSASGITYTSADNEEMNDDETELPAVTDRKDKPVCRCSICGKGFESTRLLQIHEQLHTKFKPYACRYCSKRFAKIALRIKHECTHNLSSERSYSCPLCHTVFAKRYHLQLHLCRIHSEPPIKCPYCTESFTALHELGKHLEMHDIQESERDLLYMLSETVDDSMLMDTDENSVNGTNGSVKDENIGETVDNGTVVEENQKIIKPVDTETCKHCGLNFHKSQMRFHEKEHAAEKPYECPICQKRFGYRNNLKSHLKLHEGIKPYHCQVCNARFTRGSTLRRHARKHGIYPESLWDMFLKSEKASRTSPKSSSFQDHTSSSLQHSVTSAVNSTGTFPSVRKSPYTVGQQNAITQSVYSSFNSGLSSATSMLLAASPFAANYYANQSLQCNALNLSLHDTHKPELPQDISSSISHSTPRSTPSVELHQDEPGTKVGHVGVQVKPAMFSTSVQANLCCKSNDSVPVHTRPSSTESSHLSSPSSFSGSEVPYGSLKDSKGDNVSETLAGFVSSGKLFKCDLCECFYTEYAMYRIHKRLHIRGYDDPYICPVCEEDCHDRVYFSLHIYEHLH